MGIHNWMINFLFQKVTKIQLIQKAPIQMYKNEFEVYSNY